MRKTWTLIWLLGCGTPAAPTPAPEPAKVEEKAAEPKPAAHADGETYTVSVHDNKVVGWTPPKIEEAPEGPLGDSIRRGHELFTKTNVLLPEYDTSNMSCSTCHLDAGRQPKAAMVAGATARFPKYMERTGATIALQDRMNYCFTRSLGGNRIPTNSQEMTDLMAYVTFISKGVPVGMKVADMDIPILERVATDPKRGEELYTSKGCVACHGADGAGVDGTFPALWGPKSYSIGASMAREERAASFIHEFMPKTAPGSLSVQESFDLSAFINSHARPDSPGKENDWPSGGTPYDVPYDTSDHKAYNPPPLLPRPHADLSVVPKPPPVPPIAEAK